MSLAFVLDHRADVDPDGDVVSDGSQSLTNSAVEQQLLAGGERGVGHFRNVDVRLDPTSSRSAVATRPGWPRGFDLSKDAPIDAAWVVAMCDLLPPAVFSRTTGPVKAASIEYGVHLAIGEPSVPSGEYVYLSCRSRLSNEGFAVEDATMWAADGRVLAVARQTRLGGG